MRARRALGLRRIGHLGTLDPFASGLLVLLVGRTTRLARLGIGWQKAYVGVMRMGTTTDTDDPTGTPTATSERWRDCTAKAVGEALTALKGLREQVPPAYSAKKIGGRRAYRRARSGEAVALAAVPVTVHRMVLLEWSPPDARFETEVSSGTYVRELARSVGERLGCGAHLAALHRTRVGPFHVDDAVPADDLTPERLQAPEPLADGWPRRDLSAGEWEALRHGRPVPATGVEATVTLFVTDRLVGIAEADGVSLKPRVILADP